MTSAHKTQMAILGMGRGPEMCRDVAKHTDKGLDYGSGWPDWAKKKSKTHTQQRCPTCNFWVIWKRKARGGTA